MEKLKQRVASSSSRVIASLQQAATGTFQQPQQQQPSGQLPAEEARVPPAQQTAASASTTSTSAAPNAARLMAADATAHLTEKEREILLQVFKKEEQFQRDTIKQMTATRTLSGGGGGKENKDKTGSLSGGYQSSCSPSQSPFRAGSATPSPRPNSSAAGGGRPQFRTGSACSTGTTTTTTTTTDQSAANTPPLGQCRICRKFILANETWHLCSACKQFVCEDCGSYSTSEQHWMCSSCRRRATKPAIPADALKELGLNQNSSAVRRMTLRLNQAELKQVLGKGSGESNASSNSSSGCSSLSVTNAADRRSSLANSNNNDKQQQPEVPINQKDRASGQQEDSKQQLIKRPQVRQTARPSVQVTQPQSRRQAEASRQPAQCDLPAAGSEKPINQQKQAAASGSDKAGGQAPRTRLQQAAEPMMINQQLTRRPSQQQPPQRATPTSGGYLTNNGGQRQQLSRKHSAAAALYSTSAPQQSSILAGGHQQSRYGQPEATSNFPRDNEQSAFLAAQQFQPQQYFTASTSGQQQSNGLETDQRQQQPRHRQSVSQQQQLPVGEQQGAFLGLIPIPADQIHLRRLSDQSNLVRRSSVIAEAFDPATMSRNRSHSNIDTVSYANYFYQQPPGAPFDNQQQLSVYSGGQLLLQQQQRRPSDSSAAWVAQQEAQYQQQQRRPSGQQQMSSLITSCYSGQKLGHSSDEMNSNSSSDIDDDNNDSIEQLAAAGQLQGSNFRRRPMELDELLNDQQCEPNEYFAPPRAPSNQLHEYMQQQQAEMGAHCVPIPSVSVSEVYSQPQRRQSQLPVQRRPEVASEEMSAAQLNVAIEEAISRQQQANNELLLMIGPRRASSGRVLPKIPGQEQSRSLLDLPLNGSGEGAGGGQQFGCGGGTGSGGAGDSCAMLGLPSMSPTIRRASAPEGQNIKIVVDDIDCCGGSGAILMGGPMARGARLPGSALGGGPTGKGGGGELLERLVLYRDESIDPNTNMARGFGLQVMGGKISPPNELTNGLGGQRQPLTGSNKASGRANAELKLQACVSWVLPGGPADKVGLKRGDVIVEWDGKCLIDMSYEQVADVIESSANIAELLVKPATKLEPAQPGANYVRSQRRMSQQTERDLRRCQPQTNAGSFIETFLPAESYSRKQSAAAQQVGSSETSSSLSQQQRVGTGRRLPRIPGASGGQLFVANHHELANSSPANLIRGEQQIQQDSNNNSTGSYLLMSGEAQQSVSAGELYPTGPRYAASIQAMETGAKQGSGQWLPIGQAVSHNGLVNSQQQLNQVRYPGGYLSSTQDEICGLIGLQVNVDERVAQLEISILSAINIDRNPSLEYSVKVKILPESNRFKPCTTQPSCDMNWKETFIFQNFPTHQVQKMALEIGIWVHDDAPRRLSTHIAQPICETLISIQSARERNTDFWPLWPPPTSPQARRKSLNDLIETHSRQRQQLAYNEQLAGGSYNHYPVMSGDQQSVVLRRTSGPGSGQHIDSSGLSRPLSSTGASLKGPGQDTRYPGERLPVRGRSSSARCLPGDVSAGGLARAQRINQSRRASDEAAGSSSHRLSTRVSPAQSRRSISVMSVVGGDGQPLFVSRPSSRLASAKFLRRDSNQMLHQQPQYHPSPSGETAAAAAAASAGSRYSSPSGSQQRVEQLPVQQQQVIGVTPSGRRSSLVGIQSMTGYRSQKNSQSGCSSNQSDQESPRRSNAAAAVALLQKARPAPSAVVSSSQQQPTGGGGSGSGGHRSHRSSVATTPSQAGSPAQSGPCSRRGSTEHQQLTGNSGQLQRKGSFAMQTLRKLKRTMSLTKGSGGNNGDSNLPNNEPEDDSRRSSWSSECGEDLGLTRRLLAHTGFVGKIKLSFIMTKGQLEVEVISAQGLKFDQDSTIGIYVKLYLKGIKGRVNKRKTKSVPAPIPPAPTFKQLIKYDGSLVDDKSLEVSVWQKQGGLRSKTPIGFTEIQLNELNLELLQTSWYNLRPMDLVCSSSIDE